MLDPGKDTQNLIVRGACIGIVYVDVRLLMSVYDRTYMYARIFGRLHIHASYVYCVCMYRIHRPLFYSEAHGTW